MRSADRRHFLRHGARLAVGVLPVAAATRPALAALPGPRALALHHTHTGEALDLVYAVDTQFVPAALGTLNQFLRDHYTGSVGVIDPQLFELLHRVRSLLGTESAAYEVISGYRCPETNDRLRGTRGGGVARHSLHMEGRAIDVRLPGVPLKELRDAALALKAGGVGYYEAERFVHVDTGRVRSW
ncbi:twin-arginine translocation pathway signal protein [Rubrivivax gelatinosus]|uniref:Murein endopeptidase K n=1 Tax=Rubrivivax gelatinosus TaxID=28068 RepID=A0ABS1DYD8_RUBGE|nr:DUF882 domain-containing protein [Rubrivivax gelatinosus]MBK1613546.1 twin-arginine translocation pathway signal protein [Rubrivivax gelatinosus]MBK1714151.1 twin-arginine translocation pathway signal protein [Rubrivivax gelatinosus]